MGNLPLLAIVFLTGDVARGAILRATDSSAFFLGHDTIGLRLVFHLVDMHPLLVESIGILFIQLTAGNSLVDPFLLIGLSLINPGRLRLCKHR